MKAPAGSTAAAAAGTRVRDTGRQRVIRPERRRQHRRGHRARLRAAGPGSHRRTPASRPLTRAWRLARTAAGVTVTAVLLAAVPWGLARLARPPLPGHWPGWHGRGVPAGPLSGGAIITVLAGAAWLLWALFAATLITEIIAVVRGRPAPRLRVLGPVQALAAAVAGATVLTAVHLPRAAPSGHAVLTAATAAASPGRPPHQGRPSASRQDTARRARAGPAAGAGQDVPRRRR